ncbi:MAG: class I SAM-dependent methyltransferase [Fibrobacterales bacterium]
MSQNRFYTLLNTAYDELFPLKEVTKTFFDCYLNRDAHVLDIGCATGSLSSFFAKRVQKVVGLDVNQALLEHATNEAHRRGVVIDFHKASMVDLQEYVNSNSQSLISCIGNTLPHLHNDEQCIAFLTACKHTLVQGCPLILQIVNYDWVLSDDIKELPLIETESYHFRRSYSKVRTDGLIDFSMVLKDITTGKKSKSTIQLNPITQEKLVFYLKTAGFHGISLYGSFEREPLGTQSKGLIIEAL